MARAKGIASFSANFEPQVAGALDARNICWTKADLILATTWEANDGWTYAYKGMLTCVKDDTTSDNNGLYWLKDEDFTEPTNWLMVWGWIAVDLNTAHRETVTGNPHAVTKAEVGLWNVQDVDTTNASNITTGTLPNNVLPPLAIASVFTAANETEQLALTAEEWDTCIRTDELKTYIHNGWSAGTMADWSEILTPTDAVVSVNGKTGVVVLTTWDLAEDTDKKYVTDAMITALTNLQTDLDAKEDVLWNPDVDWKILSSTTEGVRSWISNPQAWADFDWPITIPSNGDEFTGTTPQDLASVFFPSTNPTSDIDADTANFGLYEVWQEFVNPTIKARWHLGGNPAGAFTLVEYFRGTSSGAKIWEDTNPVDNIWVDRDDTFTVSSEQRYTVKFTDDQGRTCESTNLYTFTLPTYGTSVSLTTYTKQSLKASSSSYFSITMVAEDDTNKQVFDYPASWAVIWWVQFYNTVSSSWEWLGGSKAASLWTWTETATTHTVQWNVVSFRRYTHSWAKIGSRQLRFYK